MSEAQSTVCSPAPIGRSPTCVAAIETTGRASARTASSAASTCSTSRPTHGLDEERTIAAFLHAARIGLFDMSWNVLCPGCGGVLDANATLKTVDRSEYNCALCAAGYEPTLDEMVEVTFTVSPRVRRIAAHDPHTLPPAEYCRQIFWGSGVDLPDETSTRLIEEVTLELDRAAAGREGASCRCSCRPSSSSSSIR